MGVTQVCHPRLQDCQRRARPRILDTIDNKNVEIKDLKHFLEEAEQRRQCEASEAEQRRQREVSEAEQRRQREASEAEQRIQQLIKDSKQEIIDNAKESEARLANHITRVDKSIDHVYEAVVETSSILEEIPPAAMPENNQKKHVFSIVSIGASKYITIRRQQQTYQKRLHELELKYGCAKEIFKISPVLNADAYKNRLFEKIKKSKKAKASSTMIELTSDDATESWLLELAKSIETELLSTAKTIVGKIKTNVDLTNRENAIA